LTRLKATSDRSPPRWTWGSTLESSLPRRATSGEDLDKAGRRPPRRRSIRRPRLPRLGVPVQRRPSPRGSGESRPTAGRLGCRVRLQPELLERLQRQEEAPPLTYEGA